MTVSTLHTFLTALTDSQVIPPRQLDTVVGQLRHQFPNPRDLAGELLRRDWLTPFQVNQLLAGQGPALKLGPYRLRRRLGEGGSGQVFQAEHVVMKRFVALKILRADLMADAETRGRFEREIQAVGRVAHAHVVQAYDAGTEGPICYLAMEYVEGEDLHRLVKREGPLPVDAACDYIRQAALGLQHIHAHGLVHRDIKPSNLILTRPALPAAKPAEDDPQRTTPIASGTAAAVAVAQAAGVVKVLDLGLARLRPVRAGERTRSLTADDGMTLGTLDYLSPEQAVGFHHVDIRSDIYSLGCTFYFLLTGHAPFPDGPVAEVLLKHQTAEPPPVNAERPEVPEWVAAVVRHMMAKRPEDRFPTPADVVAALPAPLVLTAGSTVVDHGLRGWTARLRAPRRSDLRAALRWLSGRSWRWWAVLTGGLAALALVTVLGWQAWDRWATQRFQISARDGAGATTFGDEGNAGQGQGKSEVIRLREPGRPMRGLVRFDLSALRGRRNIVEATLELALTNPRPQARTIQVFGVHDKNDAERWDEGRQNWWGLPQQINAEKNSVLLGIIHVGREAAAGGGTVSLSGPALVDFLRKDTNDVVTFGLLSPDNVAEPVELASRRHPKLAPPLLRVTLR